MFKAFIAGLVIAFSLTAVSIARADDPPPPHWWPTPSVINPSERTPRPFNTPVPTAVPTATPIPPPQITGGVQALPIPPEPNRQCQGFCGPTYAETHYDCRYNATCNGPAAPTIYTYGGVYTVAQRGSGAAIHAPSTGDGGLVH